MLAFDQRAQCRRHRLDHHRARADVISLRLGGHLRERVRAELAVGACCAAEVVGRHTRGIKADDTQGRGRVDALHTRRVHPFVRQPAQQALAEETLGQRAEEGDRHLEPRQAEGDVVRRAADARVQRYARRARAGIEHIHQRFAADHDHRECIHRQPFLL